MIASGFFSLVTLFAKSAPLSSTRRKLGYIAYLRLYISSYEVMQILVYAWFFTVCYNSIVTFEENCKRFIYRGTRQLLIRGRYFSDYSNCLPKVRSIQRH